MCQGWSFPKGRTEEPLAVNVASVLWCWAHTTGMQATLKLFEFNSVVSINTLSELVPGQHGNCSSSEQGMSGLTHNTNSISADKPLFHFLTQYI